MKHHSNDYVILSHYLARDVCLLLKNRCCSIIMQVSTKDKRVVPQGIFTIMITYDCKHVCGMGPKWSKCPLWWHMFGRFAYGLWFHLVNLLLYLVFLASLTGFVAMYDFTHMKTAPLATAVENDTTMVPSEESPQSCHTIIVNIRCVFTVETKAFSSLVCGSCQCES